MKITIDKENNKFPLRFPLNMKTNQIQIFKNNGISLQYPKDYRLHCRDTNASYFSVTDQSIDTIIVEYTS
jgi:hypothetical protein